MPPRNIVPKLSDTQKEALNFYTRSHYLIINNLLCQKFNEFLKWLPIVNNDDRTMIKEALEQGKSKRFNTDEKWGEKIFNAYIKRTTDTLTRKDVEKHLNIAVQDILEINQRVRITRHLKKHLNSYVRI